MFKLNFSEWVQLCTQRLRHYPMRRMPPSRSPLSVLPRLRRSLRLAVLALAVFVLRVGLVTACAPNDLAESLAGDDATAFAAVHVDEAASTDPADHSGGHCLHCSCHHAAAVPVVVLPTAPVATPTLVALTTAAQANAPPDLSLRPPIG